MLALHAVPVLVFRWFPTLDGPGHLYNARIVRSLMAGDGAIGRFFEVNSFPEPNWLGHAIMAGVMTFAPAHIAEKTVMLLYVIGLPLAFRFALRHLGSAGWATLLIFPFIYGFTFRVGFLNFSLALPLLLLSLGMGLGSRARWPLALVLTILYFAHLTCFLLAMAVLFGMPVWTAILNRSSTIAQRWRTVWPIWRGLLMCSAPALLLTIAYFLTHPEGRAELRHLPVAELWTGLLNGRPFVALTDAEGPYARAFAWVLAAMTIAVVVRHLGKGKSDGQRAGSSWLAIMALVMVVGYFVLPDQMATGAFASIRLLLFAYLLWALWLGVQRIGRIPMALLMTAYIAADLLALKIHYANTEGLNGEVAEMLTVAPSIPEHAVILPLNYGDNWLHSNFPCYLGTMRNAVILDNFCALAPHNPVHWKAGTDPNGTIGSFATSDRPCVDLDAYILEGDTLVDYVFTWKLSEAITDSCTNDLRKQLASAFDLAAVSPRGDARLYRRRK